jgi:uncharacterized membrane protein
VTVVKAIKSASMRTNFKKLEEWLSHKILRVDLSTLLVGLGIILYSALISYFTIMRHFQFGTHAWDLGIFNQSFWITVHGGGFFYSTVELLVNPSGNFFGIHLSPILFLVLPIYAIYPAPQSLLAFQSFILALGAVPLYKLSFRVTKYRSVALLLACVYLLYPALHGINWFDFHVQSFLPLFFLSAFYFLEKQSWGPYLLFIALSLMCEEHAALVVVFIGLLVFLQHRRHILAQIEARNFRDTLFLISTLTIGSAILWYFLTILVRDIFFVVNPAFASTFKAASNWKILGVEDPMMILPQILLNPVRAMDALGYDIHLKVSYLVALFGPLAFVSFRRMRYLLPMVPWLVYALFSNYQPYYVIFFQYPGYVIAFVFVAAIYALSHETTDLRSLKKRSAMILLFSVMAFLLVSPFGLRSAILTPDSGIRSTSQRDEAIHQLLAYVPSDASILSDNTLFAQVSSRSNAYAIPSISPLWIDHASECRDFTNELLGKVDYVLVDFKADPLASSVLFSLIQNSSSFRTLASADSVLLLKRDYVGDGTMLLPYNVTCDYNSLSLRDAELKRFPNSTRDRVVYFNGSFGSSLIFSYDQNHPLAQGEYVVAVRFAATGVGELFRMDFCTDGWQKILFSENFSSSKLEESEWTTQTFSLSIHQPITDFEFRAIRVSSEVALYFDYVKITQIGI